jgi:putative membrane protein
MVPDTPRGYLEGGLYAATSSTSFDRRNQRVHRIARRLDHGGRPDVMGFGSWGMGGGFGMILFWILAILAIVWLLRALDVGALFPGRGGDRRPDAPKGDGAVATLRERYARGEIDGEEFERRRLDLTK